MGYDTRLMGSGVQPSPYMGAPTQPQVSQPPQQAQQQGTSGPGSWTYSSPAQSMMNAPQGQSAPPLQTWQQQVTNQQGQDQRQRLAAGLSRM